MVQRSLLHGLVACVFAFSSLTASSALADEKIDRGKAVQIVQIVKFITWPGDKAVDGQKKIEVCVLGENPIINEQSVFRIASKSSINFSLVKENNLDKVNSHCHALFIGASEGDEYKDALTVLKNKPVLTIGDAPDFAERGGMIALSIQGGKPKFIVNKDAISKATLYADPGLLEHAVDVIND